MTSVVLNCPISDVDIDGVMVVDEDIFIVVDVSVDIFEAIGVSVELGEVIDTSDVIDGTWEEVVDETTDSVDEAVEVSDGSGGIDSSVDIVGRVEVFVVEDVSVD